MNISFTRGAKNTSISNNVGSLGFDWMSLQKEDDSFSCIHKADGVINPTICDDSDA